jgi:hypothetical protein
MLIFSPPGQPQRLDQMTPEEHAALNARIDELQARVDALTARLDSMLAKEPEDPTQRILPIPEHMMPHLPPLPEGKTEWVGRGEFEGLEIEAGQRCVFYWDALHWAFGSTFYFSEKTFHIEAV